MADPSKKSSNVWPLVVVCLVLTAGVLLRPQSAGSFTPQPLPPMMAQGWLNSDGPPDLEGKVVVVDAWFTRCGPCLASLPRLARLHEQWSHDPRVQFVGLTWEKEPMRDQIEQVIASVDGFDWPVGYGASPTLDMLGVSAYPTLFVFNQSGVSVWSGHDIGGLSDALDKAL